MILGISFNALFSVVGHITDRMNHFVHLLVLPEQKKNSKKCLSICLRFSFPIANI